MWVGIVPVQEVEAWLLLDESAIRRIVSKPNGTTPLNLPNSKDIENTASPKELLQQVLLQASEATGKRLDKYKKSFGSQRRLLLERLPVDGPLLTIPSWKRMRDDLCKIIEDAKSYT